MPKQARLSLFPKATRVGIPTSVHRVDKQNLRRLPTVRRVRETVQQSRAIVRYGQPRSLVLLAIPLTIAPLVTREVRQI